MMNHRIEAYRFFLPISILYLVYFIWNQIQGGMIPGEWLWSGLLCSLSFGAVWSYLPTLTQTESPSMNELVPVALLLIFLLILISIGQKTGTTSLLHTVLALLYFRSFMFQLKRLRDSKLSRPWVFVCLSLGFILGLLAQIVLLTATFKGFSPNLISLAQLFSIKGAHFFVLTGMVMGWVSRKKHHKIEKLI